MPGDELRSLLSLVGALVADPGWAELHPRPCTDTPWPGIQCETDTTGADDLLHVTSIHVGPDVAASPPCKPSASLPPAALLHLPVLKTLSLFGCFLSPNSVSLPPSLFTNSSSLEQLVLNSNPGLAGEIPSSVSTLKKLRVLGLSENSFHGGIPSELGSLWSLQQLDLSYNRLGGSIPEEIGRLLSLRIVDLSSNDLRGALPASIGSLHSLQKIDLSFNSLSGQVPPELGKLENLLLLDLSHNKITGPLPEALSDLKQLEYLLMENNPFNTSIPLFVGSLNRLSVIGFSECGLLGPIPSFFGSLVSLNALSLDRNRLNGSVPENLGSLPKLGELNLSQNQLSGEISFSVEFVKRLGKRLDVRGNKDLCAKANKYEKASSSFEAPSCLGSGRNSSWGGESGVEEDGDVRISPSLGSGYGHGCHFGPCFLWHLGFQWFAIVLASLA